MTQIHNARHRDQRHRLAEAALEVVSASRYVIDEHFQVWAVERREGQEFHNLRRVGDLQGLVVSSGPSRFEILPTSTSAGEVASGSPGSGVA